jgi:hypothetical protein
MGVCKERNPGREAEESSVLEAGTRERLVKTQHARKRAQRVL